MKSNNDIKIEIVSKINDEIIERATNTRNKLIKKPKKNIKKMIHETKYMRI